MSFLDIEARFEDLTGCVTVGATTGRVEVALVAGASTGCVDVAVVVGTSTSCVEFALVAGTSTGCVEFAVVVGTSTGCVEFAVVAGASTGCVEFAIVAGASTGCAKVLTSSFEAEFSGDDPLTLLNANIANIATTAAITPPAIAFLFVVGLASSVWYAQ